jgi:hypothetical protein
VLVLTVRSQQQQWVRLQARIRELEDMLLDGMMSTDV